MLSAVENDIFGRGVPSDSLEKQAFVRYLQCTLTLCSPGSQKGGQLPPVGVASQGQNTGSPS